MPARQQPAQPVQPALQPRLHGRHRTTERVRDLGRRQAVHEPQRQRLAELARQRSQCSSDLLGHFARGHGVERRTLGGLRQPRRIERALLPPALEPRVVDEDADQPRHQRACFVPPVRLFDRVEERRLHEVFGPGRRRSEVRGHQQQLGCQRVEHAGQRRRIGMLPEAGEEVFWRCHCRY
jgi:hypothetical protein